jgi:hypothetical protein
MKKGVHGDARSFFVFVDRVSRRRQGDIPHVGPDASTLVSLPYERKHIVHTLDGDLVMPRDLVRVDDRGEVAVKVQVVLW